MPLEKHILSKSTFVKGHQCEKALYLYRNRPDLKPPLDAQTLQTMESGTNVGLLAQQLFPGGVDASPATPYEYQKSVELTQQYIKEGKKIIYEACFQYDGVLCALDILVNKNGKWYAYEVKSSTDIKDYHYTDTALQYYVITNAGLKLKDISIVCLNNKYTKNGALEISELFKTESVLKEAKAQQDDIAIKIKFLKEVLKNKEPKKDVGKHCFSPFECEFHDHCWEKLNVDPIIWNLYSSDFNFCLENKIYQFDKIPSEHKLHGKSKTKLKKLDEKNVLIDKEKIKNFLKEFKTPYYYLDFETFQMAVPEFDNQRPYQIIPFQYSLHIAAKNEMKHEEFLGDGINDPRIPFMEKMIKELGKKGSIITYNATFEKTRTKELIAQFPKYAEALKNIYDRIVDLMVPFQKCWYYHPNFQASYSIKVVLPTLIPKLSYSNLAIQNGGDASSIYPALKNKTKAEQNKIRKDLLAYCKLDTLAMVKIHEYLIDEIK